MTESSETFETHLRHHLSDEAKAIIDRYQIELPLDLDDVRNKLIYWLGVIPKHMRDKVKQDFNVLFALLN